MLYYAPAAETRSPMCVGPVPHSKLQTPRSAFRVPHSKFRIQELPMPRPAVLDDVRRAEVLALASHGFSRRAIADYVDCAPNTIANTAERDPAFGQQLRLARSKFVCRNIEVIQRHAAMSPKHSTWLLERLDPEKFARRSPYSITPAQLTRHFQTWTKAMIAAVPPEARIAVAQTATLLAATHLPLILHADAPDAPADDDTQPPGAHDVTFANDSADGAPAVPPSPTTNSAVPPVPADSASSVPPAPAGGDRCVAPAPSGPRTNIAVPPAVGVRSPAPAVPPTTVPPTTSPPIPLRTPSSALPTSSASILHSTYMNLLSALLLVGLVGAHALSLASHAPPAAGTVVIERNPPHVMPSAVKNPWGADFAIVRFDDSPAPPPTAGNPSLARPANPIEQSIAVASGEPNRVTEQKPPDVPLRCSRTPANPSRHALPREQAEWSGRAVHVPL
jgi:hypothetical protein